VSIGKNQVRKYKKREKKKNIKKWHANSSLPHLPLHNHIFHSFQYPFNFITKKYADVEEKGSYMTSCSNLFHKKGHNNSNPPSTQGL